MHIAIIGSGYSGTITAAYLLEASKTVDVTLIDPHDFGLGAAYSTPHPYHLLNVPAGKMSAFEEKPEHFVDWLKSNGFDEELASLRDQFISRANYGRYLKHCLEQVSHQNLHLKKDVAVKLDHDGHQWKVTLKNQPAFLADKVVLALGNPQPDTHIEQVSSRIIENPWDWHALKPIPNQAKILIVGTGLTMVDMVLSLRAQNHQGPITALSRRGLSPLSHRPSTTEPLTLNYPKSLKGLLRYLREYQVKHPDIDWRNVVDGLRPVTQELWQDFSTKEKRRFLRHLRSYWDVHRHRIAPSISKQLEAMLASKQLKIIAGRIKNIDDIAKGLQVDYQLRHQQTSTSELWDYVIYCVGPNQNYKRIDTPLIHSLREDGHLTVDALNGIAVDQVGALINQKGSISDSLYSLGPPLKSTFWECIAVPDIRKQAKALCSELLS